MLNEVQAIIRKYTGREVDIRELQKTNEMVADLVVRAALDIQSSETALRRMVRSLRDAAARIEQNLDAGPEDRVVHLNPHGEVQSENPDAVIAKRHAQIEHLQRIVSALLPA